MSVVSWLDDDVYACLAARNAALCVADSERLSTPVRLTADYAYFRLRDEGYSPADVERWGETIARETGQRPALNPHAIPVEAGVVQLMTLAEAGYILVRP